jgi:hypothetical protein
LGLLALLGRRAGLLGRRPLGWVLLGLLGQKALAVAREVQLQQALPAPVLLLARVQGPLGFVLLGLLGQKALVVARELLLL